MCLQAPQLDALMNTEIKSLHWLNFDSCNFGEHCVVEIFIVVLLCVIQWCLVSSLWCLPFLLTQTASHTPLIPQWGPYGTQATRPLYHLSPVTAKCEAPVLFKALTLYIHLLPRIVTGQHLTVFTINLHYDTLQEPHIHTRPHPHLLHWLAVLSPDNRHIYIYIYISPPFSHIWHSSWTWPLKVMAPYVCKMLGTTNAVTQCHIPGDVNPHAPCCDITLNFNCIFHGNFM